MRKDIYRKAHRDANRYSAYIAAILLTLLFCTFPSKASAAGKAVNDFPGSLPPQPEKVTFTSLDSDLTGGVPTMLSGFLFRPDGPGPFPAVVALHGCGGLFTAGKMNARFADWGPRLAALGYVVLFPDSFTPRGISESCTQKDRSGFSASKERRQDANGALLWLQSQSMVQADRVGIIGWSNGGSTLLATIGASSKKDGGDDFRVAIAFYPGCSGFVKKTGWQPNAPLTILIGEADDWTPASSCRALVDRAKEQGKQADIVTFPNAFHDFDHPNLPLKTRKGLAFTVNNEGTARIGTDPEARAAALEIVPKLLEKYLGSSSRR